MKWAPEGLLFEASLPSQHFLAVSSGSAENFWHQMLNVKLYQDWGRHLKIHFTLAGQFHICHTPARYCSDLGQLGYSQRSRLGSECSLCFFAEQLQGVCREQPSHPKAHYRKGVAHRLLGNYDEAKESFIQAKEADPSIASDMDREILQTKRQVKATNLKEKQDLSAFFDRKIQPRQQWLTGIYSLLEGLILCLDFSHYASIRARGFKMLS